MFSITNHVTEFRTVSAPAWAPLVALLGLYLLGSAIAPPLDL
ncbi:hypothetical protein [Burkholderia cenocepacia]|nr:hypothetical protein [Burkholderia cenocepacia]